MTIRARTLFRSILPFVVLAALGGCGESADEPPATGDALSATSGGEPSEDCLLLVWEKQDSPEVDFDRSNDLVEGGAISCATGTSPSQYQSAIDDLRRAARSNDRAMMLEQVGIPLLYIDAQGGRRELRDPQAVDAVFDEIFDPQMRALLRELDISAMTVEKGSGGFFGLGALWLAPDGPGGKPRIATINRLALAEALSKSEPPEAEPATD